MEAIGLLVTLGARSGKEADAQAFLESAQPLALNERRTLKWYAIIRARHQVHDQVTRLVSVEGWSAITWWSGVRFDDLLHCHPPVSQAKWACIESSVNLDANGKPDPYLFRLTC
jgi:hypothetical protein